MSAFVRPGMRTDELDRDTGLMHAALEALTPSIAIVDGDGTILNTNEAWRRFARENRADEARTGAGVSYLEVCRAARGPFSEHADEVARGLERILAGELAELEIEYPCPRGSEQRWFLLRATPLEGRPGLVAAHIDITALKGVEWRARCVEEAGHVVSLSLDAREQLTNLIEFAVPKLAPVCAAHLFEGENVRRIALAKADGAKWGGAQAVELCGPDCGETPPAVARAMATGQSVRASDARDFLLRPGAHTAEALREVEALSVVTALVVPLRVGGRVLGAVTFGWRAARAPYAPVDLHVLEEVTERAAVAVDNAEHYEEKEKAIHARDDILAVVSHDMRNLLNQALLGTGILLRGLPPSGPTKKAAEIVGRSTERMRRLVTDLLDYANVETGRLALERQPTRIATLVREAQQALEPLAERAGTRLRVEMVGEGELDCDPGRVQQVLSNLVGNAVKFSRAGAEIVLRVEVRPTETWFTVIDTGRGIKVEDLSHVFERYWRGREASGSGLGLAIAKGIVEGHGGRISVESKLGTGTTFRFTLPSRPTKALAGGVTP
jgi:signal transduction histidine kinase